MIFPASLKSWLAVWGLLAVVGPSHAAETPLTLEFQWMELGLADLDALLTPWDRDIGGLRKELDVLSDQGKAGLARHATVVVRPGQRGKISAVENITYGTEFTEPEISSDGTLITPSVPSQSESVALGVTVEVDSSLDDTSGVIELNYSANITSLLGYRSYGQGAAKVELPDLSELEATSKVRMCRGETRLLGSFRPHDSLLSDAVDISEPRLLLLVTENSKPETAPPDSESTGNYTVHTEFFETELARFQQWIMKDGLATDGEALHSHLETEQTKGNATLLDSIVVSGLAESGSGTFHSVKKILAPSHYDRPNVSKAIPARPAAFESWPIGWACDLESEWRPSGALRLRCGENKRSPAGGRALLSLSREIGEQRYLEGESQVSFPLFHFMNLDQEVDIWPTKVAFLGILRPETADKNGESQKIIVVFAKAWP